jgi:hypothetical protein
MAEGIQIGIDVSIKLRVYDVLTYPQTNDDQNTEQDNRKYDLLGGNLAFSFFENTLYIVLSFFGGK